MFCATAVGSRISESNFLSSCCWKSGCFGDSLCHGAPSRRQGCRVYIYISSSTHWNKNWKLYNTILMSTPIVCIFFFPNRNRISMCRYSSLYARPLLQMLRDEGIYMRPLGNVIYLMCGPCTSSQVCTQLLVKLYRNLEEFHHNNI